MIRRVWDDDSRRYITVESLDFTGRTATVSLSTYLGQSNYALEHAPGHQDWPAHGSVKGHEDTAWRAVAKREKARRLA